MVDSDDQFQPIRMTESDDTRYPISRGEIKPPSSGTAVKSSMELRTGRYKNDKFHISRQAITRSATEHDLLSTSDKSQPSDKSPPSDQCPPSDKSPPSTVCALHTRSSINPACLRRASEINGFMPKGLFGQRVPWIYLLL
jgi:hypothetical protein